MRGAPSEAIYAGHCLRFAQKKATTCKSNILVPSCILIHFNVRCVRFLLLGCLRWRYTRNISCVAVSLRGARGGHPVRPVLRAALHCNIKNFLTKAIHDFLYNVITLPLSCFFTQYSRSSPDSFPQDKTWTSEVGSRFKIYNRHHAWQQKLMEISTEGAPFHFIPISSSEITQWSPSILPQRILINQILCELVV